MKVFKFFLFMSLVLLLVAPVTAGAEVARHGETPGAGGTPDASHDTAATAGGPITMDTGALREVKYVPNLDGQVPLDIPFRDETGKPVVIGDYLGSQPLLISINDFSCQDLCPLELQNLVDAMDQMTFKLGTDYKALAVSLNPANTSEDATAMRNEVVRRYKRPDAPNGSDGWHFLTGDQPAITRLTEAVGLKYAYDPGSNTYAHPIGVVLLTPEGRIARYIYGMDFPPNQLRLAVYEASQGTISSYITPVLLLCYHYDPSTGRYTNVAMTIVRTGGVLTVLGMGTFIGVMLRRDFRGRKSNDSSGNPAGEDSDAGDQAGAKPGEE